METARPGHRFDTGEGKTLPPTVTSVRHADAMAGYEQDASAHCTMKEGGGAKNMAPGSGGGEGGHIQGLQRVWTHPGDGELFKILGAGDISDG